MRSTITAKLTGDTTLMALLTGGLHTATEITRQLTPTAFDANGEIKPCALVKIEGESPVGPYDSSGRLFAVVYLYERTGYTTIDAALDRAFVLLNLWKPSGNVWQVRHADDARDLRDEALACSMGYGRYVVTRLR
jgi:hypothetical protein